MAGRVEKAILYAYDLALKKADVIVVSNNALKVIDVEHERIHRGKVWYNNDEYFIPPNSTSYFVFKADSNSGNVHIRNYGFVSDQGPMKLFFKEEPFIDVNSLGTELRLHNMNRTSVNSSQMILYAEPAGIDVNSLGLTLSYTLQPESAPGNQPAGGSAQSVILEWVVPDDKYYLFSLENTAVNTATIESQFFVYRSI